MVLKDLKKRFVLPSPSLVGRNLGGESLVQGVQHGCGFPLFSVLSYSKWFYTEVSAFF